MLSRAEPTRSPWYSPTVTGFIQQVETPHLALTAPGHCASLLDLTAAGDFTFIWSWCLLFLHSPCRRNTFSGGASHLYSPWLKMSHASLKKKLGFLSLLKIRKLEALTLISTVCILQIWSQCRRTVSQRCKCLQLNFSGPLVLSQHTVGLTIDQNIMTSGAPHRKRVKRKWSGPWVNIFGVKLRGGLMSWILLVWFVGELEGNG